MKTILKFTALAFVILLIGCKKEELPVNNTPPAVHPYGAGKGRVTIYAATDLGQGSITCYIDGQSAGTITQYGANTTCGSGDVNVILTAGTHTFTATAQSNATWNSTFSITEDVCSMQQITYSGGGGGGGGGTSNGNAIFYLNQNSPGGSVTVNCGGQTKYISTFFSTTPACGTANAANFNLPVGTYNYTASTSAQSWSGSINVTANSCSSNLLTITGTTGNTGVLNVWSSNTSVGTITVTCGGLTRYITTKYSSAPTCQASGCAIFDLPFGNYTINASAVGYSWNPFPISITSSGSCYQVRLQ